MGWTDPRTWNVGEIITKAIMDAHVKMNLRYLHGDDGATTLANALILPDGAGFYIHIPSLTTAQRDALTPTAGMLIYNSTTTQFNKYENTAWRADLGFNSDHSNLSGLTSGDDHTQYQLESLLTTQGDMPYATAASTWARLPKGTAGQVLVMNGAATAPEWGTGLALITSGSYTGNATVNRAVAHGLGVTPKIVFIAHPTGGSFFRIYGSLALIMYQNAGLPASGSLAVTIPNATNFYVGNATDYGLSANTNAVVWHWVALG